MLLTESLKTPPKNLYSAVMSARDLLDDAAILDDEEDDESFDEDTGEVRRKTNGTTRQFEDSSEEDEDDDDEEEAAKVSQLFSAQSTIHANLLLYVGRGGFHS
jgi:hypothetical protein